MSISFDGSAPSADTSPISATPGGKQQSDADLEQQAHLFRTLLVAPDPAEESANSPEPVDPAPQPGTAGRAATDESKHPYHSAEYPPGSLSARDLAMAALWSGSLGRSQADPRDDFDSPLPRLRRLQEPSDSAAGGTVLSSAVAQPSMPGPPAASTAVPFTDPSASLAELIEIHVRRTLLSVGADGTGGDEVRIELSDAVLPGTSLALRRLPGGWQLSAVADNSQSLQRLTRFAPALVKRFAAASLGSLEIQTALGLEPPDFLK